MSDTLEEQGISKSDKEGLEKKLSEIEEYYQKISGLYLIKADLVAVTDKRHALSQKFEDEIEKYKTDIEQLKTTKEKLISDIDQISDFKVEIEEIQELLNATSSDGVSYNDQLKEILLADNISSLQENSAYVAECWESISQKDENDHTIEDRIKIMNEGIITVYSDLFDEIDEETTSKKEKLYSFYKSVEQAHSKIISGYTTKNEDGEETSHKSYFHNIKKINDEFTKYYPKIFGDDKTKGLKEKIESQLLRFKDIETEADKVINLSSDAGLAAGFHQMAKKAKNNKHINLAILMFSLVSLGVANFSTIDFDKIKEIELISLAIRAIVNTPFIWLAMVSNKNLNKYSRIEEEYSHKESLARSFERYKEQIANFPDNTESSNLMIQLLKTNITAFEKNAAETMQHARSDFFHYQSKKSEKNQIPMKRLANNRCNSPASFQNLLNF